MADEFYFEDRVAGEFQRHATEAAALAVADETLAAYRRDAIRYEEWSTDVDEITIGRIVPGAGEDGEDLRVPTHRATMEGDEDKGYDYAMRGVEPAPAPGP